LFSEDAPSVAKEIARSTLHQIAEWPEQTAGAFEVTNATKKDKDPPGKKKEALEEPLFYCVTTYCGVP
jgi:hypothetical protein